MNRSATIAITAVASAVAIACSIATGQWTSPAERPQTQTVRENAAKPSPLPQPTLDSQAVSAVDARLGVGAEVETITYYSLCGHRNIVRAPVDHSLIGKTRDEIAASRPSAKVTSFSTSLVTIEYDVPLYCPQHYLLKQNGDGLVVYQTVETLRTQTQVATFHLTVSVLPADIQKMLRDGMVFNSLGEIEAYLEDLDS